MCQEIAASSMPRRKQEFIEIKSGRAIRGNAPRLMGTIPFRDFDRCGFRRPTDMQQRHLSVRWVGYGRILSVWCRIGTIPPLRTDSAL